MSLPVACILLFALAVTARGEGPYPEPPPPVHPDSLGRGVQRTMTLLATSSPTRRNRVRILFYGQSITQQEWWKAVVADLRRRFPHAEIEAENRAIGGFASQWLIRPAEHDLYPFYPDLLVFHVYGSDVEYEQIIRSVRSRTAAEVLIQKDHATRWPPDVVDESKDKGAWWDHRINTQRLPEIARRYGCGLAEIREDWLAYLRAHQLEPKDLLADSVHLNAHGNFLMAALVSRYLVYRPELPREEWRDLSRDVAVGRDIRWRDGVLRVRFEGNRVDALALPGGGPSAEVWIDGKRPSEVPDLRAITRPRPGPWSPAFPKRVDHDAPLLEEEWTLRAEAAAANKEPFSFNVTGSRTGRDGDGRSDTPFVSTSGRVRIAPEDWFRTGDLPAGFEVKWTVVPLYRDVYQPPARRDAASDNAVMLAQGLPNGPHVLELRAPRGAEPALRAIRVYRPPVR